MLCAGQCVAAVVWSGYVSHAVSVQNKGCGEPTRPRTPGTAAPRRVVIVWRRWVTGLQRQSWQPVSGWAFCLEHSEASTKPLQSAAPNGASWRSALGRLEGFLVESNGGFKNLRTPFDTMFFVSTSPHQVAIRLAVLCGCDCCWVWLLLPREVDGCEVAQLLLVRLCRT